MSRQCRDRYRAPRRYALPTSPLRSSATSRAAGQPASAGTAARLHVRGSCDPAFAAGSTSAPSRTQPASPPGYALVHPPPGLQRGQAVRLRGKTRADAARAPRPLPAERGKGPGRPGQGARGVASALSSRGRFAARIVAAVAAAGRETFLEIARDPQVILWARDYERDGPYHQPRTR